MATGCTVLLLQPPHLEPASGALDDQIQGQQDKQGLAHLLEDVPHLRIKSRPHRPVSPVATSNSSLVQNLDEAQTWAELIREAELPC